MAWREKSLCLLVVYTCVQIVACVTQPEYSCFDTFNQGDAYCHNRDLDLPGGFTLKADCMSTNVTANYTELPEYVTVDEVQWICYTAGSVNGSDMDHQLRYLCSDGSELTEFTSFSLNVPGDQHGSTCFIRICVSLEDGTTYHRLDSNECGPTTTPPVSDTGTTTPGTTTQGMTSAAGSGLEVTPDPDTAGDSIDVFVEYILAPVLALLILLVLLALVVILSLCLVLQLRMRKYTRNWQIYGSPELPFDPHYVPVDVEKPTYNTSHRMSLLSVEGVFQSLYVDQAKALRPLALSHIYGSQYNRSTESCITLRNLGKDFDEVTDPDYVIVKRSCIDSSASQSTSSIEATDTLSEHLLATDVPFAMSGPPSTSTYVDNSRLEMGKNLSPELLDGDYDYSASFQETDQESQKFDSDCGYSDHLESQPSGNSLHPFPYDTISHGSDQPYSAPPGQSSSSCEREQLDLPQEGLDCNYDDFLQLQPSDENEYLNSLSCEDDPISYSGGQYTTTFQPHDGINMHLGIPNPMSVLPHLPHTLTGLFLERGAIETSQEAIQLDSQYVSSESGYIQSRSTCTELPSENMECLLDDVEELVDGDSLAEGEDELQNITSARPSPVCDLTTSGVSGHPSESDHYKKISISDEELDILTLDEPSITCCHGERHGYITDDYTTNETFVQLESQQSMSPSDGRDINSELFSDCKHVHPIDFDSGLLSLDTTSDYQLYQTDHSGYCSSDYVATLALPHDTHCVEEQQHNFEDVKDDVNGFDLTFDL